MTSHDYTNVNINQRGASSSYLSIKCAELIIFFIIYFCFFFKSFLSVTRMTTNLIDFYLVGLCDLMNQ